MKINIALSAVAIVAGLAVAAPAFADDMQKPMDKKMMHHKMHHKAMHHDKMEHKAAMHKGGMRHHGMMSQDAKEREETMKLNQGQLQHPGM